MSPMARCSPTVDAGGAAPGAVAVAIHRHRERADLCARLDAAARRAVETLSGMRLIDAGSGVGGRPPATPALTVMLGDRTAAHYLAVPEGPEEAPFRELLAAGAVAGNGGADGPPLRSPPQRLAVFIAPSCPRCPVTVRSALALALASADTVVEVIDASLFPELAERIPVRSVPTLVADTGLTVVGAVSRDELADRLAAARGAERETVVLASLVEGGRLREAGRRLTTGPGAEAFAELWLAGGLESRIALLLAADLALECEPTCLDRAAPVLERGLRADSPALRGDTADLLRRLALPSSRPALEAAARDSDPDVAEAAAEAVDALTARRQRG